MPSFDPSRLYVALLNTGLQTKDNALYQVIYQLISAIIGLNNATNRISSSPSSITNIIQQLGGLGLDSENVEEGFSSIPGPIGPEGPIVPYFIGINEIFHVPLYKQALFAMNIDNEGTIDVDGFLIEVD